jgi:hypothetical protein
MTLSGFLGQFTTGSQRIEIYHCENRNVLYKGLSCKFGIKKGSKEFEDNSENYNVWEVQAKAGSVLHIGILPN